MNLAIDQDRLLSEIETLARISDADPPAVTRIVFTPIDLEARKWFRAKCLEQGLAVRQDAIGNMFARWNGTDHSAPPIATGSHFDAIPNAGKYDGVVGVLGGLEAIRALQQNGFSPKRSIELILFTSEEPTRFGIGCLGSRMLSGTLSADAARRLKDTSGRPLEHVRQEAGMNGDLESVRLDAGHYGAFVELHIEQGPLLERAHVPLGIVESIAAPASYQLVIEGARGHAGGVLMLGRKDALCAAAEVILAVEEAALASGSSDTVATVGICDVFPGAVNSIPSRVKLTLDLRDTDLSRRDRVMQAIENKSQQVSQKRGVDLQFHIVNADAPAICSSIVTDALIRSCGKHDLPFQKMVSRAYHDSLFMSRITPTGMLFIPCRNGYSHRPDEFASPDDITRGTLILAETLAELSR
ncbi:MAG TPA: M20 family metallo-hydrolase [Candidatus Saccharimonadales bacterium]|nr:M20 family metallo-hydrolase [Candidatus Saccharimonadales bacterium]